MASDLYESKEQRDCRYKQFSYLGICSYDREEGSPEREIP
jgi:hypothetical protein